MKEKLIKFLNIFIFQFFFIKIEKQTKNENILVRTKIKSENNEFYEFPYSHYNTIIYQYYSINAFIVPFTNIYIFKKQFCWKITKKKVYNNY